MRAVPWRGTVEGKGALSDLEDFVDLAELWGLPVQSDVYEGFSDVRISR